MNLLTPRFPSRPRLVGSFILTLVLFDAVAIATAGTFQSINHQAIVIPDSGVASPYPSTVNVSLQPGEAITALTVTLTQISHPSPNDLDILLVGPHGHSIVLMGRAGAQAPRGAITNTTLTFADCAAAFIPGPA